MKKWIQATRAPFLTASATSVFLGGALAYYETGRFDWFTWLLTFIGCLCLHLGANMSNDYYDHKTTDDDINETPTPFSGGSRVIQEGLVSPKAQLGVAFAFFGIGIVIGLYIWSITPGNTVLYLGLAGFLSGYLYTAGPVRIAYRGWGEVVVGLNFGVLEVLGTYFVQTGHLAWSAFLAGIPMSLLVAAILYINQFPDYEADKAVSKNHWVVRLGRKKARKWYYVLMFASYAAVLISVLFDFISPWGLLAMATLPLAVKAVKVLRANCDKIEELMPANALTIQIHLLFGMLMTVGLIAGKVL